MSESETPDFTEFVTKANDALRDIITARFKDFWFEDTLPLYDVFCEQVMKGNPAFDTIFIAVANDGGEAIARAYFYVDDYTGRGTEPVLLSDLLARMAEEYDDVEGDILDAVERSVAIARQKLEGKPARFKRLQLKDDQKVLTQ